MPSVFRNANTSGSATNLTQLNVTTAYTIAFWAKQPNGDLFAHGSTANLARDGYAVWFDSVSINVRHCRATASTNFAALSTGWHQNRVWQHYALVWQNSVLQCFVDGTLRNRIAAAAAITANASCTTRLNPAIQGNQPQTIFDLQIIPNAAVPEAGIKKLMDPKQSFPATRARWFGLEFGGAVSGGTVLDESGNNSNLTSVNSCFVDAEPPYLPTLG
jgi:hypothetical protein